MQRRERGAQSGARTLRIIAERLGEHRRKLHGLLYSALKRDKVYAVGVLALCIVAKHDQARGIAVQTLK